MREVAVIGVVGIAALFAAPTTAASTATPIAAFAADPALGDRVDGARRLERCDGGRLWGRSLEGVAWCFVRNGRVILTSDPKQAGYASDGEFWTGPLPDGIAPANTAIDWAGRRWAMVLLPLPDEPRAAARLLIHEAWHVVQPGILSIPPYSETGAGSALLDGPDGRTWLRLEWRALVRALRSTGDARTRAIEAALLFRARRDRLATADERARERALDVAEGMAEYTAWKLTGATAADVARTIERDAPGNPTWVRAFAYFTGPAYGYLLDAMAPGWIAWLRDRPDLEAVADAALPTSLVASAAADGAGPPEALVRKSNSAAAEYGIEEIRAAEDARWTERQRRITELRRAFVEGPTLRVKPGVLRITFDYRGQTSLGDDGTVMPRLVWRGEGGAELSAPGGALVTNDWSELRVPLAAGVPVGRVPAPLRVSGPGWDATIPAGWAIAATPGGSLVATPPGVR